MLKKVAGSIIFNSDITIHQILIAYINGLNLFMTAFISRR